MKETNMEHFRSEIEAIVTTGYAVGIYNNYPFKCDSERCDYMCDLNEFDCGKGIVEWLMSEYKPEPVLTAREKGFVECMKEGWIARDRDGCLMWHEEQPWWYCDRWDSDESHAYVYKQYFAFITDEDPWSVEELRKLKALEYNPEDVAFKGDTNAD